MKKCNSAIVILSFFLISTFPGTVFGYLVTLDEYTGYDAQIQLDINDTDPNLIAVDVLVVRPINADILGIWFDLEPFPESTGVIDSIVVAGAEIIQDPAFVIEEDAVIDLGNGNTLQSIPSGAFDFGVRIGTQGMGDDYFHSASFTITTDGEGLFLGTRFGARITSVGDVDYEESSKLVGIYNPGPEPGTTPVPEPATMLLFGTGLIGLAGLRLRKKNK